MANRIHVSPDTANLLIEGGKRHWITKRKDVVTIRGKTDIISYWIKGQTSFEGDASDADTEETLSDLDGSQTKDRFDRLVEWNVGTLLRLIKEIVATRAARQLEMKPSDGSMVWDKNATALATQNPLSEVVEIITLPDFKNSLAKKNSQGAEVDRRVEEELRHYVSCVASMYRQNAFHNFEHASHGESIGVHVHHLMSIQSLSTYCFLLQLQCLSPSFFPELWLQQNWTLTVMILVQHAWLLCTTIPMVSPQIL